MLGTRMQRAAVVAAALCSGLGWCQTSYAGADSVVTATALKATSGRWGVVASATTFSFTQSTQRFFFTATNVGTLPLRGATYTLSITGLRTGNFWILACVGGT